MSNQSSIPITFNRDWILKRPYLYRYMDKAFVDEFFKNGSLRLSSFRKFSEHPHELCRDASEGAGTIINKSSEGEGQTFLASISQGQNAYILCGSSIHHPNIAEKFQSNSGFRINDIAQFANAISSYVPGFVFGVEGPCHYVPNRVITRYGKVIDLEKMKISENALDMHKMFEAVFSKAGDDLLFLKEVTFADEYEYRLIWNTLDVAEKFIDIKCLEASKFCTRFEDLP